MWLYADPNDFNGGVTSHTSAFSLLTVVGASGFLPVISYFAPVGQAIFLPPFHLRYPLSYFDKCIEAANCCILASNCLHVVVPRCIKLEHMDDFSYVSL